jgi:hypothetical protein
MGMGLSIARTIVETGAGYGLRTTLGAARYFTSAYRWPRRIRG